MSIFSILLATICSPLFPITFSPSVSLSFFFAYSLIAPKFARERQRAYILSAITSCFMTLLSLPFAWSYFCLGFEKYYQTSQEGWMEALGRFVVNLFRTYLIADLVIGHFKYPSQIGLLTGWIHHTVYIGIMTYLLNTTNSPIFLTGALMELPTFDLAISNLFPSVRHDLRFLISFLSFRIIFHAYILIDCLRPSSLALTGSWVPVSILALAWSLHAMWFRNGVTGYVRRARCRHRQQAASRSSILVDEPPMVEPESVEIATPEESPLITPKTPPHTSLLSLPISDLSTFPNLPAVSTPTFFGLSLTDPARSSNVRIRGSEFKDAVKSRWEEQRRMWSPRPGGSVSETPKMRKEAVVEIEMGEDRMVQVMDEEARD